MVYARNLRNIPFIRKLDPKQNPFSELEDKGGVDDPKGMLEGWTGWARRGRGLQPETTKTDLQFEASVGRYLTNPSGLLQILADRRRAVAIISAEGVNFRGEPASWSGTGFIAGPNLLLTNHHVLNSVAVARTARVEFNYEISPDNLLLGDSAQMPAPQTFRLDPARLFVTSPTYRGLDYTFVWIEDAASKQFGIIPLERSSFTVKKDDQAFVIHHPEGQPKQVSLDDTDIINNEVTVIHYSSDTMEGSSGAPVHDRRGRLIALHHASRKQPVTLVDGVKVDRVNEGIKISAIALDLENRVRMGGDDASAAETILKEVKGSDTMSGFFGGYGRQIDGDKPAPEAVVDTYRGTDQDIDIGFWNIEWLANRWEQPGKLEGAAKVIVDLNLDAWGLSEFSPPAIKALIAKIAEIYSEDYDCAFSEPNAPESKQSTAMIWKKKFLKGSRIDWPESVEPLFRRRSDDPDLKVEAVHGKIFDRYPALYRFSTTAGLPKYDFFAVPLHLKAMDEGSLRRRLATRILARAVQELATTENADIILGGDMNAPLVSGDFSAIEDAGFLLLGAQDEKEGAFSYIKAPRSAIDNIFLLPSMRQTVGRMDYFIVAKNRTMPNYLAVSDHVPVAVRLSLVKSPDSDRALTREDVDKILDDMLIAEKQREAPTDGTSTGKSASKVLSKGAAPGHKATKGRKTVRKPSTGKA